MIKEGIRKTVDGIDLTYHESREIMKEIMSGNATDSQIGAFLTALRMKGETIQEISASAAVMREFCFKIHPKVHGRLVDTCGTGGDRVKTFNVSTASAFVVAGAGVPVAKHGNRSVTSKCGSADVLETLGLNLNLEPQDVQRNIEQIGIGFMFAPMLHPAMKYAIGPRREIGIRTIFNILGPVTNPAGAQVQVLGVYDAGLTETLANVLNNLGSRHVFVVHGGDGLDEITITDRTYVAELVDGQVRSFVIDPVDFGMSKADMSSLVGGTAEENAQITLDILKGERGPRRDIVLLNSAAAIAAGGKAANLIEGIQVAAESIDSGKALEKLELLKEKSMGL